MKKALSILLFAYIYSGSSLIFAAQTPTVDIGGVLAATASVSTSGGNILSSINPDTGALNVAFSPAFQMSSNDPLRKTLTLIVEANTTTGYQNAVFDSGGIKYIIMTNVAAPPAVSSLTDIKSGSPTAINNPNAIAYTANGPQKTSGNFTITYQTSTKTWTLVLNNNNNAKTTFTIPAGAAFTNTFSSDDASGNYQSRVTLSFTP